MDKWLDQWTVERMDGQMSERVDRWTHERMNKGTDGWAVG